MKNSQNFTNIKKKLRKAILKIWKISMAWNGNTRRMEIFQIFQIFQITGFLILLFYFFQYQSILMRNIRNFTNLKKKTQKKAILRIWKMSMVSHGNFPNFFQIFQITFFLIFSFISVNLSLCWWKIVEIFTNLKKKNQKNTILKNWNISMVSHGNFPNFANFPNRLFLDFGQSVYLDEK